MKPFHFFLAILMFATVTNCNVEDNNCCTQPPPPLVTWNLVQVVGGVAGVDQTIHSGLIQWTFDPSSGTLTVLNNNIDNTIFDFYETGTYAYSVEASGTDDIISIDGEVFGAVTINQTQLVIDQQIADGFVLTFRL